LRNVTVAKIAGSESQLLQTSSDARQRISRIADFFSEEELTRFLQIMLRSYNDISYRSDQRFHLELALLKLVHAQRLLPVEQLLSGASLPQPSRPAPAAVPVREQSQTGSSAAKRPSPLEIDRARRSAEPEMSSSTSAAVAVQSAPEAVSPNELSDVSAIQAAVLQTLENAGHRMLASTLESGSWKLDNGELFIQAHAAPSLLEMALSVETKRVITAAASTAANRTLRLRIESLPGGNGKNAAPSPPKFSSGVAGTARQRAADDPFVRRLQEKFGAEIRTVIDHREKKN
jgi:DNA polymerase-3 subunit gamma/tau